MQKDKYGFPSIEVYNVFYSEKEFSEWRDKKRILLRERK